MTLFSYHLLRLPLFSALRLMLAPPRPRRVQGLLHAETMTVMVLGSSLLSGSRMFSRQVAVFAQWENEEALIRFLEQDAWGKRLAQGWHLRLRFMRQWGRIAGYQIPAPDKAPTNEDAQQPVVAVTLARMRYLQIPRFIRWGRPVEKLVRDDPGTTLSLASIRYPNTVSTFSIWKTQQQMTDMVQGHSKMPQPRRHIDAMQERNRKDFHFEFTTLRFQALSEHGMWQHRSGYFPFHRQA